MPGQPDVALASMGIYIFNAEYLYMLLEKNIEKSATEHDFGRTSFRRSSRAASALAHPFSLSCVTSDDESPAYWRDVGTIDAYWSANLDLASTIPSLDLYDGRWPIWTNQEQLPPAKFVSDLNGLQGTGTNLLACGGCVVSGSQISRTVLSSAVRVHSFCNINEAVLLPQVTVERSCRLRKVVIDRGCTIPEGTVIGEDPELDAARFYRTASGVVLVTREALNAMAQGRRFHPHDGDDQ